MAYRLTIDGQNFTPQEWKNTQLVAGWDEDVFSIKSDDALTFSGEGYQYLIDLYEASYCNIAECVIYFCDEVLHEGLVFLSEAQIDRKRCTITVAISDTSWNAKVKNKRKQVYYLDQTKSSDNSTIAAASSTNIEFHYVNSYASGSAGAGAGANSVCYSVDEALSFLIRAMTNDEIGYTSDYFGQGGEGENFMLCTGREIRNPGGAANLAPGISFEDLYADLKALLNLRIWIEEIAGTETVRIEPFDYFRAETVSLSISNSNVLTERVQAESVYSTIKVGTRRAREASETPTTSFEQISYLGWGEETYNVRGDCVTDTTLNLQPRTIIVDSNSIEAQLLGEESMDDDVFLVATDGSDTLQYDFLGLGEYYYNYPFTNSVVSNRWANRIHNAGFSDRGDANGDIEASPSADQPGFINGMASIIKFNNEISDPDTAYDPSTLAGVYTAPDTGLYLFTVQGEFDVTYSASEDAFIEWVIEISVNLTTYEVRRIRLNSFPGATISYSITQVFGVNVSSTDTIVTSQDFQNSNYPTTPDTGTTIVYKDESRFEIEGLFVGNSVPLEYSSEYPMTADDYNAILANRESLIDIDGFRGYPKEITYRPMGVSSLMLEAVRNV